MIIVDAKNRRGRFKTDRVVTTGTDATAPSRLLFYHDSYQLL